MCGRERMRSNIATSADQPSALSLSRVSAACWSRSRSASPSLRRSRPVAPAPSSSSRPGLPNNGKQMVTPMGASSLSLKGGLQFVRGHVLDGAVGHQHRAALLGRVLFISHDLGRILTADICTPDDDVTAVLHSLQSHAVDCLEGLQTAQPPWRLLLWFSN